MLRPEVRSAPVCRVPPPEGLRAYLHHHGTLRGGGGFGTKGKLDGRLNLKRFISIKGFDLLFSYTKNGNSSL